jgi:hypothetical protein
MARITNGATAMKERKWKEERKRGGRRVGGPLSAPVMPVHSA